MQEMGLAFDDWDLDYYTNLFKDDMKRDPTNVELFDIAQSNSEHSRHWFFRGDIVIDGEKMPSSLFQLVKEPWKVNPNNSVVAFKDNSSAIRGFKVQPMLPVQPGAPSPLKPQDRDWDLLLTAETHNFPCAVAPYPGELPTLPCPLPPPPSPSSSPIDMASVSGRLEGHPFEGCPRFEA